MQNKNVLDFFLSHFSRMLPGLSLILCRVMVVAPMPWIFKVMIDHNIPSGDTFGILLLVLISIGLLFLHYALGVAGIKKIGSVTVSMVNELRIALFSQIQKLSYSYLDRSSSGKLISKYSTDTHKVQDTLVLMSEVVIPDLMYGVTTLIILMILDWRLSIILVATIPIYFLLRVYFGKRLMQAYENIRHTHESLVGNVSELISALRYLKTLGNDEYSKTKVNAKSHNLAAAYREMLATNVVFWTVMYSLTQLLSMLVVGGGAYLVIVGEMSIGTLVAYLAALPILLMPIDSITRFADAYFKGEVSYQSIRELTKKEYIEDKSGVEVIPNFAGSIEFDSATFAYSSKPSKRVLDSFSLNIKAGENIALVGASGSGKSTIANLILGLYQVNDGSVKIDGIPLQYISMGWFRQQCAVVQQDTLLLSGSIIDNIRLAREGASDDEVYAAAKLAHAEEFILKFSDGYQTHIGERGAGLSGGQRQRISIARALLRNPKVLILDEATSALDRESEDVVKHALERVTQGRTVITIAHRLNTISNADRIIVLADGEILEQGTFDELLNKDSYLKLMLETKNKSIKERIYS